jgi:hypothetical protein
MYFYMEGVLSRVENETEEADKRVSRMIGQEEK